MKKHVWFKKGDNYHPGDISAQVESLENGVYTMHFNPGTGERWLSKEMDIFKFDFKIYGMETSFVKRVLKTYKNTTSNLGVLLNGIKGTGKTITAEIIANELKQPVIMVEDPALVPVFVKDIQQPCTFFFDEYEKLYRNRAAADGDDNNTNDASILSIMDGAMNGEHRRMFLLTTNETYINDNLLQRPGRLRYIKEFGDLESDIIIEIVDDLLKHKHLRDATIEFISELKLITVDIVKAVVNEVNIHEESPEQFKNVFNVQTIGTRYNIYKIIKGKAHLEYGNVIPSMRRFNNRNIGSRADNGSEHIGTIREVISSTNIKVESYLELDENNKGLLIEYQFEEVSGKHSSFYNYHYSDY